MTRYPLILASLLASLVLTACMNTSSGPTSSGPTSSAMPGRAMPGMPSNIAAAIADGNRPDADRERDADRKPGATLEFMNLKSGEQVAELLPAGGYFTRLFSKGVGPTGHVYALVPERPANASADLPDLAAKVNAIAADANYANVSVVVSRFSKLLPPVPVDLFFTARNYHDLHNFPIDIGAYDKAVFDALKPGGLYVVLDHSAQAGSEFRDTATLHRVDAEAVRKEIMAAGFEYVGASDALANAEDSRTTKVFDPAIRGKTDQFILKFRKPRS